MGRLHFYLLEAHGLEPWLVNARDVKHLPGRPKTDVLDSVWLCKVAERQMHRPSFVPPAPIRRLRDLTRYRTDLVGTRTAEKNRVEKLLEDACFKLSVVASDIGSDRHPDRPDRTSEQQMIAAIPAAQGVDPDGTTGPNAGTGPDAAQLPAIARLDEIPGIGPRAAHIIIAEIGLDMTVFPTPGHLVSWAKMCPRANQSGARNRSGTTGKGNPYLKGVLGEVAAATVKTNTFLGHRYRRLIKRLGKLKALVAVARSILIIIWHLLADPAARYVDLGPDFHDNRINADRGKRNHIRQLEALGYTVTLTPAA